MNELQFSILLRLFSSSSSRFLAISASILAFNFSLIAAKFESGLDTSSARFGLHSSKLMSVDLVRPPDDLRVLSLYDRRSFRSIEFDLDLDLECDLETFLGGGVLDLLLVFGLFLVLDLDLDLDLDLLLETCLLVFDKFSFLDRDLDRDLDLEDDETEDEDIGEGLLFLVLWGSGTFLGLAISDSNIFARILRC